jgi:hypothetical protein
MLRTAMSQRRLERLIGVQLEIPQRAVCHRVMQRFFRTQHRIRVPAPIHRRGTKTEPIGVASFSVPRPMAVSSW